MCNCVMCMLILIPQHSVPLCGPNGRGISVPTLHFPFSVRAPFDMIMRAVSPLSLTRVTFYTDTLNIYTQRDGDKTFVFVSTRVLKPPTLNCLMMSGDAKPGRGRSWSEKQWLGQLIALLPSLTVNVLRTNQRSSLTLMLTVITPTSHVCTHTCRFTN